MKLRWLFISCLLVAVNAAATEIVYQPINPSFGGNPMNGSFLLQKAQSQNAHSAPDADRSFVDRFREALERNIINSLSRRIADGEIVEGLYDTGEYTVEVVGQPDGSVVVYITHNGSGEQTVITMPSI